MNPVYVQCAQEVGGGQVGRRADGGAGRQHRQAAQAEQAAGLEAARGCCSPDGQLRLSLKRNFLTLGPLSVSIPALQFDRMRGYMKQHVGREQGTMFADATGGQGGALAVAPGRATACGAVDNGRDEPFRGWCRCVLTSAEMSCAEHVCCARWASLPHPAERMEGELQGLVAALLAGVQHLASHMLTRLASHFSVLWCVHCAHCALHACVYS